MSDLKAIDPPMCGCTDCITGYLKPWSEASTNERHAALSGALENRTGYMWGDGRGNTVEHPFPELQVERDALASQLDQFRAWLMLRKDCVTGDTAYEIKDLIARFDTITRRTQ
ncbi:hypothetical protein KIH74_22565 [Kineosporia sp. J2-2]|uniref:Uncharacterized protein n=1 Tax=Kineosporia corallincola TaxID=2835133 RepID=A0ABS5TKY5_9ACTN|nr:hypothetical protein [Kineosporia corallincola]MBT0771741.1 hypothetical protein [Kineosporia corallincola]